VAITHVGNAPGLVATQTGTTSIALTIPAAVQAGDILVIDAGTNDANGVNIADNSLDGVTWNSKQMTPSGANSFSLWWKRATASSANATVTVSGGTANTIALLNAYRGCVASGDPIEAILAEVNASGNNTQAAITTLTADAMVVCAGYIIDDRRYTANSADCTDPATLTTRNDVINAAGAVDSAAFHASAPKTTAGSTGAFVWTWAANAAGVSRAYALTPATGGPTTVEADGNAAGVAAPGATSGATKGSDGAGAGVSTPTGQGAALKPADAAAGGVGTPAAIGAAVQPVVAASAGVASPATVSVALLASVGTSSGVASVSADGEDVGGGASIVEADGASAGSATTTGLASAVWAPVGSAAGTATPTMTAASIRLAQFASSGLAAVVGEGTNGSFTLIEADGASSGSASGSMLSAWVSAAVGASASGGGGGFPLIIND
jgi:hypothetical protein